MKDNVLSEMLRAASCDLVAEPYITEDGRRAWVVLTMRDPDKRVAEVYSEEDARLIVAAVNTLPELLARQEPPQATELFDVWHGGNVHYTRPVGHPLLDEARAIEGYEVRPHDPARPRCGAEGGGSHGHAVHCELPRGHGGPHRP